MVNKATVTEKIIGQAASLNSLVEYQKEAIVSRTLIDKKAGTITLFAFAQGQGLSEHTAPFDALVYIIDGEADITIAKKKLNLTSGDMVIMPANKPHAFKANKPFKMMLVMIRA
jgi:quercetin dioxygenase-like cupin family protein